MEKRIEQHGRTWFSYDTNDSDDLYSVYVFVHEKVTPDQARALTHDIETAIARHTDKPGWWV